MKWDYDEVLVYFADGVIVVPTGHGEDLN